MATKCDIQRRATGLVRTLTQLYDNWLKNDGTTNELNKQLVEIKEQYRKLYRGNTDQIFEQALISAGIQTELLHAVQPEEMVSQLALPNLNYDDYKKIYVNALSAYNHMRQLFKIRLFRNAFVNNIDYGKEKNSTVKRIPLNSQDFNAGIRSLKNELFQMIADNLNITDIQRTPFKQLSTDFEAYKTLMNHPNVINFLNTVTLETASDEDLNTHAALMILNNFDKLIKTELGGVIKIEESNMNRLDNNAYIKETQDDYTSHWITDDLEHYGADLYQSNVGKFILSTIQKVDSKGRLIPGRYLSSGDVFMISDILKTAEVQYHVLYSGTSNYDEQLSFKYDTKKALYTLLNSKLPIISKFDKELAPIRQYLYTGREGSEDGSNNGILSIRQITKDIITNDTKLKNITQLLDVEDIIAFELGKNAAPAYIEYTTSGFDGMGNATDSICRTVALGHTYKSTSFITDNIKAQVFNQLLVDSKSRHPFLLQEKQNIKEEDLKDFFSTFFGANYDDIVLEYTKESILIDTISSLKTLINESALQKNSINYFLNNFQKLINNSNFKGLLLNISDINSNVPNTIFKDSKRKSIPIYRLNSTIFEDSFLRSILKVGHINRSSVNILIDNLHLLSSLNSKDPNKTSDQNLDYAGNTAIRLETILTDGSNPAKSSSGQETFMNSFLGDFISLYSKGMFGVQLMTYSDKSSIFLKLINLQAKIDKYGDKEVNKSLKEMSNDELFDMFYFFRKNQMIDRIYKILSDWKSTGLIDGLELPDITSEYNNTDSLNTDIYNSLIKAWKKVNEELIKIQQKGSLNIEDIVRKHRDPNFEFTKDLHYSKYGKTIQLNKNIFFHFDQIKSKKSFETLQRKYATDLANDSWMKELASYVSGKPIQQVIKDMSKAYASKRKEDNEGIIPLTLIYRRTLLDNFFRSQINDLHFKGPHLDAVKKVPNYNEFEDVEMLWEEEKKRFEAAGKRTVDLPGTKENFVQHLITGVPVKVKVAIINEPTEDVFNPMGDHDDLEILNGSARISPIYAYQETASLPGENFSGDNRKVLGMDIGDHRATLFKYAEYIINNWHMRTSMRSKYPAIKLFKKMHDIPFKEDIDLTSVFFNKNIRSTPQGMNDGKPVYFARGNGYYKLVDMEKVGLNEYNLSVVQVDEYGNEIDGQIPFETENVKIQSLYDLYTKALGGCESMTIDIQGDKLHYSENSLKMLYNYVTNVGEIIDDNADVFTQSTVRQPLRDYFIAMAVSNSGIKRGETNTNSENVYINSNNDPLQTFTIRTALFGKQLDASHNIDDDSNVTEPKQTIAALATNGNTQEEAQETYKAIAQVIRRNMKQVDREVYKQNQGNIESALESLSKDIGHLLKKTDEINQAQAIYDLVTMHLGQVLPISDPSFYKLVFNSLIIDLNSKALSRKFPGLGGVLNPPIQLFGIDSKEYTFDDLIRKGREELNELVEYNGLTTNQVAALAIYRFSDKGRISPLKNNSLKYNIDIANLIIDNQDITDGKLDESSAKKLINAVGKRINKGDIEPLDTLIIQKNGNYEKITMDNTKKYFDTITDENVTEVYLDVSAPHDLKPQRVKFEYDTQPMSIYQTAAAQMAFNINELLTDNIITDYLNDLEESGTEDINACKL